MIGSGPGDASVVQRLASSGKRILLVGGNSKAYGAAAFRLRERDFDELRHEGGVSPAWPLKHDASESYYDQNEHLFQVHGPSGEDPNEQPTSGAYPFAAVKHEPFIQQLSDD